jgi:CHAD domain-containing protein
MIGGVQEVRGNGHRTVEIALAPQALPAQPSARAPELVTEMLGRQLRAIRGHEAGTRLGADPEELHDMRVGTRRARAILRTASPLLEPAWTESVRVELAWLGGALGAVRDLDVFLARLEEGVAALDGQERRAAEKLVAEVERERQEAREALVSVLSSERYDALLGTLEREFAAPPFLPVELDVNDLAARQFDSLRRQMQRLGPDASDELVHRARIKAKRARYAAELAAGLDGRATARFVERAKRFQDVTGEHQDTVVAEQRLRALATQATGAMTAFAAGRLAERERDRRRVARAELPKAWRKLERAGRKAWA